MQHDIDAEGLHQLRADLGMEHTLTDLPIEVMQADPLYLVGTRRCIDGEFVDGQVIEISLDDQTHEHCYRVRYIDGDQEDLTADRSTNS